jgi:hyperosmotically inducible protein
LWFLCDFRANEIPPRIVFPAMRTLFVLALLGVGGMVCYNYSTGRDLLQLPGTSAEALKDSVRDTVSGAVRETVKGTATDRAEEAVAAAAVTSKIKAKMALDDLVKAADIDVDTDGGVVTLTGTVESVEERRRAVRIATETKGVTKVVEHLRVQ